MTIIASKDGVTKKIEESRFSKERSLQEYIEENPEVLPIDEIEEDASFMVASREFPTKSGPIDALGFDQNGTIYLVETKLFKNSDKRQVMAQIMDYGASLWKHYNDFITFRDRLDRYNEEKLGNSLDERIIEEFDIEEEDLNDFYERLRNSLGDGNFKFVIYMDKLSDRLKNLITFMNQNSKFDVYAVECDYYEFEDYQLLIPNLYGAEVKKSVSSDSSYKRGHWDRESFFEELSNRTDETSVTIARTLYDFGMENGEINYGTGKKTGSITFKVYSQDDRKITIFTVKTSGKITLFSGHNIPKSGKRRKFIEENCDVLYEEIPKVEKKKYGKPVSHLKYLDEKHGDILLDCYDELVDKIKNSSFEEV